MADIVELFKRSARYFKLGLLGILVTTLIHIVGFSTVGWASETSTIKFLFINAKVTQRAGLWRVCTCGGKGNEHCLCAALNAEGPFEWVKSVQAMETLGLIGLLLAIGCSFAFLVVPEQKYVRQSCIASPLLSGLFILIGICVCAGEVPNGYKLGYSFAVCCCSGVFAIVVTYLLFIGTKNPPNDANTPAPSDDV